MKHHTRLARPDRPEPGLPRHEHPALEHPPGFAAHEHHHDSEVDWLVPAPTYDELRPWFDSNEDAAATHVAFTNCPPELRIAMRLLLQLFSDGPDEQVPGTEIDDLGIGGFLAGPSGRAGVRDGVPVPSIRELLTGFGGDAQLAHQAQILLSRRPAEIRAFVHVILRASRSQSSRSTE